MSLVRLLGFSTLPCGCVVGHYRELATGQERSYVEVKGRSCEADAHRRNRLVQAAAGEAAAPPRLAQAS
jgi:hypothetical protein